MAPDRLIEQFNAFLESNPDSRFVLLDAVNSLNDEIAHFEELFDGLMDNVIGGDQT